MRYFILALAACHWGADLPAGWEDAESVDDFSQNRCKDDAYDTGAPEAMSATVGDPGIRVTGDPVHFRCDQEVEGFYKADTETVDVLVQPADMNPRSVAKCDCSYRVEAGIPEDPPATVTL